MTRATLTAMDIAEEIQKIRPEQVAVAYVGADWEKFLPALEHVKDLIVAPVLGTNPKAVETIEREMRKLHGNGWDRIHFLDALHAKLYLGPGAAVYGSANLTANGLEGQRLVELCRSTSDEAELSELRTFFDTVLARAKNAYKTPNDKKKRLDKLAMQTLRNPQMGRGTGPRAQTRFADFELRVPDQFYVSWYQDGKLTYTGAANELQSIIDHEQTLCLAAGDKVETDKWVLCWECKGDVPTGGLSWMCIDMIVPGGVSAIDRRKADYTKLVFQRSDLPKRTEQVPFALDKKTVKAFVAAFQNKRLAAALQGDTLMGTVKAVPDLVNEMHARLT